MLNSTDRMASEKAEREGAAKSARRAEEASIVSGLRAALQPDEQLLGFARARIAGGIKGRLNIGPEAFFAPFVNVGLTERRFVIQHLHGETGKPSEILPHFFALADLQSIHFADIETYGGTPASRLVLHLANGQNFRLRLTGENNFDSAKSIAEVFRSLTSVRKSASGPTQRVCSSCKHIMDRPSKFCPYCGTSQMDAESVASPVSPSEAKTSGESFEDVGSDVEKVTVVVTEPRADLLDDALAFLRNDPIEPPVAAHMPEPEPTATQSDPSLEASKMDSTDDVAGPITDAAVEESKVDSTGKVTEPITDASDEVSKVGSTDNVTEPITDAANEVLKKDSTGDVTETITDDTVVAVEPIAGASDVAGIPESSAETSNPVDTIEPTTESTTVLIAGTATTEAGAAPDIRPVSAYTFPDFSSSSPWQAPPSPFAPVLPSEPLPASEPTNNATTPSETPASIEASNANVPEAPIAHGSRAPYRVLFHLLPHILRPAPRRLTRRPSRRSRKCPSNPLRQQNPCVFTFI